MSMLVQTWRGIRFASVRHAFAAPEPVPLRATPSEGGEFGAAPLQPVDPLFPLGATTSADCLFLNVHAPHGATDLPILVWVYGGGFEAGAASSPWLDAARLAEEAGCVVVIPNYRVGTYGFAALDHHGGLLADSHNLGLRDVQTAVNWTAEFAQLFGGDPDRITLAGHSAGGFLAAAAAVAPGTAPIRALGCFSGGASRISTAATARRLGDRILSALGLSHGSDRILSVNPDTVILAQQRVAPTALSVRNGATPRGLGLFMDADSNSPLIPRHPMEVIAAGGLREVEILSAATTDEVLSFPPTTTAAPGAEDFIPAAVEFCASETVAEQYLGSHADVPIAWHRLLTDFIYRLPAARLAETQHRAGGKAAFLDIGRSGGEPAGHGTEVAALFGHGRGLRDAQVSKAFQNLIRGDGLPASPHMAIDGPSTDQALPAAELLNLWSGVRRP